MKDVTHRTRTMVALFTGVGTSATGFIAMVTVLPLVAEDALGSARWSGLPSALGIVGTSLGTGWLGALMERRGRRPGLLLGYFAAAAAAGVASLAAALELFPLLLISIFCLGVGYGASRLSRYAAADLFEPGERGRAIGTIVWAGTIGSVLGPTLLEPTRRGMVELGLPEMMGPFLLASLALGAAGAILALGFPASESTGDRTGSDSSTSKVAILHPDARIALAALVVGQVVMVLIMTMTPVHIRGAGRGLDSIGWVIASHTFGMYALSPLSGALSDRFGRVRVILLAGALLVTAGLVSSRSLEIEWLAFGLFLLGWGWNLGFVSASALLTDRVPPEHRMRLQGRADSFVWASAATAGLLSGLVLESVGYPFLCRIGAGLALVPALLIALHRVTRS